MNIRTLPMTNVEEPMIDEVEKQHRSFAVIDGTLWLQDENDHRPMVYAVMHELDCGCMFLRGNFKDNRMIFYQGPDFEDVEENRITPEIIVAVQKAMHAEHRCVDVYNGVHRGLAGQLWEPKTFMGFVDEKGLTHRMLEE